MKKFLIIILACVLVLSMTACVSLLPNSSADPSATPEQSGGNTTTLNPVETVFFPATSSFTGAYATIKVSNEVDIADETAWLGLCPLGKDYVTEEEADAVDIIWFSYDWREEGDPYVFSCDFESVEDGTYALVVTSSDDENTGYVLIQLSMTKAGDTLSFDYTDAILRDHTGKILTSGKKSDDNNNTSDKDNAECKTEDIIASEVVKIVTDEIKLADTSIASVDWAATSYHSVYDFSNSDEIKEYTSIFVTDPDKYFDTDRILKSEEYTYTWADDHKSFTQKNNFLGLSYNVEDVLDRMDQNKTAYTAFLKNGKTVHVSYGKETPAEPGDDTPIDSSKEEKSGNGKVTVLKNFVLTTTTKNLVHPFVLYRMGDEFMAVHHNDITYFVKDGDFYKCLLGEIDGNSVEWSSDWDENLNLYQVFTNSEMEFFATLMDNNSYCAKYCEKTNETLNVAGVDTVKYADESFAFYIDETTGLCFRNDMGKSTTYLVTSYETSCSGFPYAAPKK